MIKITIADTKQQEYTFAHLEIGGSNCGCFNFRNLDFELFLAVLITGCRRLNLNLELEEFKCDDSLSTSLSTVE